MNRIIYLAISFSLLCGLNGEAALAYRSVTINPNGGENSADAPNFVADQGDCISIPNPTRTGYTFAGWESPDNSDKFLITSVIPDKALGEETVFDGTSSYYDLGRNYMYTDALTVNLWAYMDNWAEYATSGMRMISCTQGGGWNIEPTATTESGCFRFAGHDGVGYKQATSITKCADLASGWHMFTLTFNGYNIKGYIDGKLVAAGKRFSSGAISYNETNSILVGAEPDADNVPATTPCHFKGSISHLSISNASLSSAGVANLYAEGRTNAERTTLYILPADTDSKKLIATWNENSATSLTLDAAEGINTMSQNVYAQPIGTSLHVTNPTREGYIFTGWDSSTSQYISNYQGIACSSPDEVEFDGSSTYYNIGRDRMYTDAITINVWAYMDNWADYISNKGMRIYSCTEGGGLGLEPYNDAIHFSTYDSKRNGTGGYHGALAGILWSELAPGWHMFTHVFNGVKVSGYLDGKLIATSGKFAGEIGYNTTNSILIGAEADKDDVADSAPLFFKGKIKNFAIMHSSISASDVAQLYANPGAAYYYFPANDWSMTATWEKGPSTSANLSKEQNISCFISDDILHVTGVDVSKIEIYNLTGQLACHSIFQNDVSIAGLTGVYIVHIQDSTGQTFIDKIIID